MSNFGFACRTDLGPWNECNRYHVTVVPDIQGCRAKRSRLRHGLRLVAFKLVENITALCGVPGVHARRSDPIMTYDQPAKRFHFVRKLARSDSGLLA